VVEARIAIFLQATGGHNEFFRIFRVNLVFIITDLWRVIPDLCK